MRKILVIIFIATWLAARQPLAYFYVLPFDNLKADPTVEWIASGLTDMVRENFKNEIGLKLQSKEDLEVIMNDRSLMLKQPMGSRNFLLLGKYSRQLDQVEVSMQLIDVATWDELDARTVNAGYSDITILNDQVNETVRTMLSPYTPKRTVSSAPIIPEFADPKPAKRRHPVSVRSEMVANNLEKEIKALEESMDVLFGAKQDEQVKPKKDVTRYEEGEWAMDFSAHEHVDEDPELAPNTQLLTTVVERLVANPYDVKMEKPKFIYHSDDDQYMTVQFQVMYSLKDEIIKEMLNSLPYTRLEQNGTLNVFYFSRESFNFPDKITETIKSGDYRSVPVIRFFNTKKIPIVVLADTPEEQWHSRRSQKVLYIPERQFSPLIEFTIGGWSLQVAMETVNLYATYEFTLPMSDVESLSNVSIKFINENELNSFLDPIL